MDFSEQSVFCGHSVHTASCSRSAEERKFRSRRELNEENRRVAGRDFCWLGGRSTASAPPKRAGSPLHRAETSQKSGLVGYPAAAPYSISPTRGVEHLQSPCLPSSSTSVDECLASVLFLAEHGVPNRAHIFSWHFPLCSRWRSATKRQSVVKTPLGPSPRVAPGVCFCFSFRARSVP